MRKAYARCDLRLLRKKPWVRRSRSRPPPAWLRRRFRRSRNSHVTSRVALRDLLLTQLGPMVGPPWSGLLSDGKPHGEDPRRSWNRSRRTRISAAHLSAPPAGRFTLFPLARFTWSRSSCSGHPQTNGHLCRPSFTLSSRYTLFFAIDTDII